MTPLLGSGGSHETVTEVREERTATSTVRGKLGTVRKKNLMMSSSIIQLILVQYELKIDNDTIFRHKHHLLLQWNYTSFWCCYYALSSQWPNTVVIVRCHGNGILSEIGKTTDEVGVERRRWC